MFAGKTVIRAGREWCSVANAARYRRTTQQEVRNMPEPKLATMQMRKNAHPYVAVDDLVKVPIARLDAIRK